VALGGLFFFATVFALYVARPVLLPIVWALLVAFLLAPIVSFLERRGVTRFFGAALVTLALVASVAAFAYFLLDPAQRWLSEMPERMQAVERELRFLREPVEQMSRAAASVSDVTGNDGAVQEVSVQEGTPITRLLRGAGTVLGMALVALALVFFFLVDGRRFLLKLVRALPTYRARKRSLRVAARVRADASTYLLAVTLINVGLGGAVAVALYFVGLPNPILWGVMAALLNYVPYLGAMVGIAIVALVSLTTAEPASRAVLAPAAYLLLTSIEGAVITPAILGRHMRLNPVAVLVFVLFWGWLWGIPGALLAVPILATLKVVAEAYPSLRPVGEFLTR